jgi:DNA-binding PadR family transcriptional regulator
VYVALRRLEQKGLVRSRMTEPTGIRAGRVDPVVALRDG